MRRPLSPVPPVSRTLLTALAVAVVVALAGSLLAVIPALGTQREPGRPGAETVSAEPVCTDALLVAVPGAGEAAGGSTVPGPTLAAYAEPLAAGAEAVGRSVTTTVVAADTPRPATLRGYGTRRTPAEKAVTRAAWQTWRAPVADLVTRVRDTVGDALASCPDQLLLLVGHSQGAEAVHRVLSVDGAALARRTVAVVLVADPARVAGSDGQITGDPEASRRAVGVSARLARRPAPAVPAAGWSFPLVSVCTRGDLGCDLGPTRFREAQRIHGSYDLEAGSARLATLGNRFGTRLALWPRPFDGQQVTGQVGLLIAERLKVDVVAHARDDLRFAAVSPLPPGVRLTDRGVLRGIPTQSGSLTVDYTVRNTASAAVSRRMPGQVSVTVEPGARSEVTAGGRHTCQLRGNNTLWCWGANFYGQLGAGDHASGPTPRQVGTAADWAQVSAGGMHTCAVRDNGTLWCWGLNYRGQLGTGGRQDKARPARVGDDRDWESVSAGWVHTCATKVDGSAWCWGDNNHGQLGSGDQADSYHPVRVTKGLAWSEVTAGGWHTCGVTRGGEAYCWGRNLQGQLGDGTYTLRVNPARVGAGSDWLTLRPAWTHTCGLTVGGSVSCWGGNEGGQLGGGWRRRYGEPAAARRRAAVVCGGDRGELQRARSTPSAACGAGAPAGSVSSAGPSAPTSRSGCSRTPSGSQLDLGWLYGCGLTTASTTPELLGNRRDRRARAEQPTGAAAAGPRLRCLPLHARDVQRARQQPHHAAQRRRRVQPGTRALRVEDRLPALRRGRHRRVPGAPARPAGLVHQGRRLVVRRVARRQPGRPWPADHDRLAAWDLAAGRERPGADPVHHPDPPHAAGAARAPRHGAPDLGHEHPQRAAELPAQRNDAVRREIRRLARSGEPAGLPRGRLQRARSVPSARSPASSASSRREAVQYEDGECTSAERPAAGRLDLRQQGCRVRPLPRGPLVAGHPDDRPRRAANPGSACPDRRRRGQVTDRSARRGRLCPRGQDEAPTGAREGWQ